jgi:hypothetical protein
MGHGERAARAAVGEVMKLTAQQLIDEHACIGQVKLFRKMFGDSVNVTQRLCVSVAGKFDFCWAARHLLSLQALDEYKRVTAPALAKYERVRAPALAEYNRVMAPALAEYNRVMALAWAECERVMAPAWAECERVMAPALDEYKRVTARTFAKLYNAQKVKS